MPSDMRLKDVLRKLKRLGCTVTRTGNNYLKAIRQAEGETCVYCIPTVRGRYIKHCYKRLILRHLHLTEEKWDAE